jgi:hypothetical protein
MKDAWGHPLAVGSDEMVAPNLERLEALNLPTLFPDLRAVATCGQVCIVISGMTTMGSLSKSHEGAGPASLREVLCQ